MGEWISVNDRLPVEYGNYLCTVCFGRCGKVSRKISIVWFWKNILDNTCLGFFDCDEKEFVTHWMELPELPKIEF